jgi:hypothetical protein
MKILQGEFVRLEKFIVGTGGVTKGELVTISGTDVIEATDAPTAATIVGIAYETGAEDAVVDVAIITPGMKIRADYVGTVLTALTDANLGSVFDLDNGTTVDLDDTTGGCAFCVGYDNDADTIDFIIPASFLYF